MYSTYDITMFTYQFEPYDIQVNLHATMASVST